jgi:hypothetical protein
MADSIRYSTGSCRLPSTWSYLAERVAKMAVRPRQARSSNEELVSSNIHFDMTALTIRPVDAGFVETYQPTINTF